MSLLHSVVARITYDNCYVPQVFDPLQKLHYLQHIGPLGTLKNLRYSI
jgi:hypothetical protein